MATRDELLDALRGRYGEARRVEKGRILTEFAAVTGYHRKHAARVLRATTRPDRSRPRPERRLYDEAVREALILLWEASDRICGKRLKPLAHRHRHRLDRVRAAALSRAAAPRRGADGDARSAALPAARPRHRQRRRVHERDDRDLVLRGPGRVHALAALPQERPGLGRAEERRRRAPDGRIPPLRGRPGRRRAGPTVQVGAAVRELLPAFVPTRREAPRGRAGAQALRRTHDPASAPARRQARAARAKPISCCCARLARGRRRRDRRGGGEKSRAAATTDLPSPSPATRSYPRGNVRPGLGERGAADVIGSEDDPSTCYIRQPAIRRRADRRHRRCHSPRGGPLPPWGYTFRDSARPSRRNNPRAPPLIKNRIRCSRDLR